MYKRRAKVGKRKSRKMFSHHGRKVHKKNVRRYLSRGGIRL